MGTIQDALDALDEANCGCGSYGECGCARNAIDKARAILRGEA